MYLGNRIYEVTNWTVAVAFEEITEGCKKQVLPLRLAQGQDDKSSKRPGHFFSQVFPLSALLQISLLLVEITTSAEGCTSM